jgi:hypothetical protein
MSAPSCSPPLPLRLLRLPQHSLLQGRKRQSRRLRAARRLRYRDLAQEEQLILRLRLQRLFPSTKERATIRILRLVRTIRILTALQGIITITTLRLLHSLQLLLLKREGRELLRGILRPLLLHPLLGIITIIMHTMVTKGRSTLKRTKRMTKASMTMRSTMTKTVPTVTEIPKRRWRMTRKKMKRMERAMKTRTMMTCLI